MSRDRADRARGALLGAFVGDALGMPFEGMPPASIPERVEMENARRGRGTYTDDTQMTIALAESLVEHGSVDVDRLGRAFVDACDLERGYGAGTLRALGLIRAGVPPLEAAARSFGGRGSLGNGAAMRVAPVAVAFAADPARVRAQAELSALVTHAHPVGIDAACVQAA
ncbi:MAG: ADP-ribosylglycohydrolase family protein, partial [Nocardioidaceae bacterium]